MNETQNWYNQLNKPGWAPDSSVFGQVWPFLYVIIIIVNVYVLWLVLKKKADWKFGLPFWLNLGFNLIFTPIQFGLRNNLLAAVDIVIVLGTLIWAMAVMWKKNKLASLAYTPYLVWVSIATTLQFYILALN